ncbi:MAG: RNA-binding S4 domain-containing protein [Pseudomonadota bacterium]
MVEAVRIDRWLWAARLYKTRSVAKAALVGGKVDHNGKRAKPARLVEPGDRINISRDGYSQELTVLGLSERRLGAPLARGLYQESEASLAAHAALRTERRELGRSRRPDKRTRRLLRELKDR